MLAVLLPAPLQKERNFTNEILILCIYVKGKIVAWSERYSRFPGKKKNHFKVRCTYKVSIKTLQVA